MDTEKLIFLDLWKRSQFLMFLIIRRLDVCLWSIVLDIHPWKCLSWCHPISSSPILQQMFFVWRGLGSWSEKRERCSFNGQFTGNFYCAWFHLQWSQSYCVRAARMLKLVPSSLLWPCQISCLCFIQNSFHGQSAPSGRTYALLYPTMKISKARVFFGK